jgi:hypothetical protein
LRVRDIFVSGRGDVDRLVDSSVDVIPAVDFRARRGRRYGPGRRVRGPAVTSTEEEKR